MIDARELRIGNLLVSQDEEPEIFTLEAIDSIEETISGNGLEDVKIENLSPIPLTEEWLKRFGFRSGNDGAHYLETENILFGVNLNSRFASVADKELEDYSVACPYSFQYVHQLQNLFFALTGKELEYKRN